MEKCEKQMKEFELHKEEMLGEFEQIEEQKSRLFAAVS